MVSEEDIARATRGYWRKRLMAFFRIGGWVYHKETKSVHKVSQ